MPLTGLDEMTDEEREANEAVAFHPETQDGFPYMEVAGHQVRAYVQDGVLVVEVTRASSPPGEEPAAPVPVAVSVDEDTGLESVAVTVDGTEVYPHLPAHGRHHKPESFPLPSR
jgi:hypothetical protein